MIPGHEFISLAVPPVERLPEAGPLLAAALVVGYLLVKAILWYGKAHDFSGAR